MVSYAAAALLAAGLVQAGNPHAHPRHAGLHKKVDTAPVNYDSVMPDNKANATCGCTTYTTTWYGEATLMPAPPPETTSKSETPSSTWVAPTTYAAPTTSTSETPTTYAAPTTSTSETPTTYAAPTTSTSESPAPPKYTQAQPKNYGGDIANVIPSIGKEVNVGGGKKPSWSGSSPVASNGNKWAMTYTPYDNAGNCKSADAVNDDISNIKGMGFSTVRLYATDCSGLQNIGSACAASGLKMIAGIFIGASGLGPAYDQLSQITSWGKQNGWDSVEMVVAGNEAVFNGYCTASELAGFIGDAKSQFTAAGYNGPVTATEPLNIIQENASTFCSAVDVIAANIHPFFNGGVDAAGAGDFVKSQLDLLSQCCNGEKEAYNLETGWPSQGDANGAAIPGVSEQKQAIDSIIGACGSKSAIFSYENDGWKAPGALGVEQFWGCASIF